MAGIGLDARMLADTSEPLKKRLGWVAYAISALRHLGDKPVLIRVETQASHGYRPTDKRIAELADEWAFAAANMGVQGHGEHGKY